jgi:xenotropic and polytropic retrovirus receptor 1
MDWSLCQPQAKKWFLRDIRGYKSIYYYYIAMVIDVILRFNWVFYIFYTHDIRHGSLASFFIAFSEVTRRGMWTLFRVENEHCANVSLFKASRDIPLPYPLSPAEADTFARPQVESECPELGESTAQASQHAPSQHGKATAVEEGQPPSGVRRRALTLIFAEAHTQDFEKKRKPGAGGSNSLASMRQNGSDEDVRGSSDEDDDEDIRESMDVEELTKSGKERDDISD